MAKAAPHRAYSYIRFSTARQAEGGSLDRQAPQALAYCKRKGLELDNTLNLYDLGVSAFRGDNVREGALAGFLEACRLGRVPRGSVLIVESLDRLSRDQIRPALQLFLSLQDFGITIVTLAPEREYPPDGADALSLIEPLIVFSRAHEESLIKSHRRRDGWRQARDKARQGGGPMLKTCPAWLEVTPEGFRVKEDAADAVRRIFALARDGLGVQRIAERLTRDGVPPIGNGARWVKTYVHKILISPAAAGAYQPCRFEGKRSIPEGAPIPNYYPAVVTETEWEEAQAALQGRGGARGAGRKGAEETNLFSGLLTCAVTGERFHIANALGPKVDGERKRYRYLLPSREGNTGPTGERIDYGVFEAAVLSLLGELQVSDLTGDGAHSDKRRAEIARLSGRVLDLDNRLERAKQRARADEDFDKFLDLISDLQDQRRQVIERRAALEREEDTREAGDLGEAQSIIAMLANAPEETRADLRRRLKDRIKQLVDGGSMLVVRRGKSAICALQLRFRASDRRRDYLIVHKPGTRYTEPRWVACSLPADVAAGDLDLRREKDVRDLARLLETIDYDSLLNRAPE
jgi:DNA invertase Pin-like site-specific DNA recombinase